MKKFALVLLAVYTMMLASIPCQDDFVESYKGTSSFSQEAVKHPLELDLCSPFCVCACCAGITLQQQLPSVPFLSSFISFEEITFAYLPGKITGDFTSIWQPPRI